MKLVTYLFLTLPLYFIACKKETVRLDTNPEITLMQAGPAIIKANTDSVYFVISYKDGDGDLGSNDPEAKNLFVEDQRIGLIYEYRIQQLVPNGAAIGIQGELHFSIANTVITGSGTEEEVNYRIWIKDSGGNESNRVEAGPFQVVQ